MAVLNFKSELRFTVPVVIFVEGPILLYSFSSEDVRPIELKEDVPPTPTLLDEDVPKSCCSSVANRSLCISLSRNRSISPSSLSL